MVERPCRKECKWAGSQWNPRRSLDRSCVCRYKDGKVLLKKKKKKGWWW